MKNILLLLGICLPIALYARLSPVDFDESMQYSSEGEKRHYLREFCKKLYEKNSSLASEKDPIIPKIVHVIWVGPLEPPPIYTACLESIEKFLPEWDCMIWTDKEVAELGLYNQQYYDEENNYGAKADIARYEILYRFGGVYLDVDFTLLKPLDVLHHTYEFYTGMMPANCKAVVTNGIIGSVAGHPILADAIEAIKDHRKPVSIERRTGPIHFQKSFVTVTEALPEAKIISLPRSFFFPLDQTHKRLRQEQIDALIKPEAFAVHFWSGSWKKGNWKQRPKS